MDDVKLEESVNVAQKLLADNDSNLVIEAQSWDGAPVLGEGGVTMKSRDGSAYLNYLGQFYNPLSIPGSFYRGKN